RQSEAGACRHAHSSSSTERRRADVMSYELLPPPPGPIGRREQTLMPGDHVKLGFRVNKRFRKVLGGEWMWVEVTTRDGPGPDTVYRGELCNIPVYIDPADLCLGAPVEFRPEFIYQCVRDSRDRAEEEREAPPSREDRFR